MPLAVPTEAAAAVASSFAGLLAAAAALASCLLHSDPSDVLRFAESEASALGPSARQPAAFAQEPFGPAAYAAVLAG